MADLSSPLTQLDADNSQILARVSLLAGLQNNSEALRSLAHIMTLKALPAGHTLITEGELGDEFFVLVEGQVSIYKKTPEGDVYKVVILKADVTPAFGEGGLLDAEPRSATVKCDVDCKVLVLKSRDFMKFCDERPQWAVPILKRLALNLMGSLRKTSTDLMLLHKALMNEIRS